MYANNINETAEILGVAYNIRSIHFLSVINAKHSCKM